MSMVYNTPHKATRTIRISKDTVSKLAKWRGVNNITLRVETWDSLLTRLEESHNLLYNDIFRPQHEDTEERRAEWEQIYNISRAEEDSREWQQYLDSTTEEERFKHFKESQKKVLNKK